MLRGSLFSTPRSIPQEHALIEGKMIVDPLKSDVKGLALLHA
jgi:hypothetical protein